MSPIDDIRKISRSETWTATVKPCLPTTHGTGFFRETSAGKGYIALAATSFGKR